jgi:hypothetical protein
MSDGINLAELLAGFPCRLLCGDVSADRWIKGGYACDLLSWVISRAGMDDVWFTILNSINVIAVATLTECACVMLTEGVGMDQQVLDRAREKSVTVLSTDLPTWEASAALADLLRRSHP